MVIPNMSMKHTSPISD